MASAIELPDGTKMMPRDFSRVVLSKHILIPPERLHPTPSSQDGLCWEIELDLRRFGCETIQMIGILLKLPQMAMATGQVLFQRFYYLKSFVKHNLEVMVMACINLGCKIEECPRRPRDVVTVFHHVKQVRNKKTFTPMPLDQNYFNIKNQLIKAERRILKELGFCVHVKHPHKIIVLYLNILELLDNHSLVQKAWNYMNDVFRTDAFVRFEPETIAAGCIQLACRVLKVPVPNKPPWYYVFNMTDEDIVAVLHILVSLYARPKPNYEKMCQELERCKKMLVDNKGRSKTESNNTDENTPVAASQPATPKASPTPTQTSGRRVKEEDHSSEVGSEKNHISRKRRKSNESDASRSGGSRSRSRSRSSRSHSASPSAKKRHRSPNKYRKDHRRSPDRYSSSAKDKRPHKRKHHSRSTSRSPDRYSKSHKKYYKEKDFERKEYERNDRNYYSPDRHRSSSRKHRNGHRNSPRDRYRR